MSRHFAKTGNRTLDVPQVWAPLEGRRMKLTYTLIGLLVTAGAVVGLMLICGKGSNDEDTKSPGAAKRESSSSKDLRKRAAAIFRRFG